jgi:hypothetical protein
MAVISVKAFVFIKSTIRIEEAYRLVVRDLERGCPSVHC